MNKRPIMIMFMIALLSGCDGKDITITSSPIETTPPLKEEEPVVLAKDVFSDDMNVHYFSIDKPGSKIVDQNTKIKNLEDETILLEPASYYSSFYSDNNRVYLSGDHAYAYKKIKVASLPWLETCDAYIASKKDERVLVEIANDKVRLDIPIEDILVGLDDETFLIEDEVLIYKGDELAYDDAYSLGVFYRDSYLKKVLSGNIKPYYQDSSTYLEDKTYIRVYNIKYDSDIGSIVTIILIDNEDGTIIDIKATINRFSTDECTYDMLQRYPYYCDGNLYDVELHIAYFSDTVLN